MLTAADEAQSSGMDFSHDAFSGKKTLNDILVMRMLYLDYFFLFMG